MNRRNKHKQEGSNWKHEEIPTLVVSINKYDEAMNLIDKLKTAGVEGNITEGGVNLSIDDPGQLTSAEAILNNLGLQIQVGITNAEAGRHTIHKINTEKKRRNNAPNN